MPSAPLRQILYVSTATRPFTDGELVALLRTSRANNARDGLTGLMLYRGGAFMQVFEGPERAARGLEDRLQRDPRHYDLLVLQDAEIPARQFSDWTMGFTRVDQLTEADEPGVSTLLESRATAAELTADPGRALRLLVGFRDAMRKADE